MSNQWIDDYGKLAKGKYCGKELQWVAKADPGYLKWILEEVVDLSNEEFNIIAGYLRHQHQLG